MPSHNSVAASVRRDKEANPSHYCPDRKCLWRFAQRDGFSKPCPKHGPSRKANA